MFATVEHETIYQFVSRTSVRDPDSQDDVQIFVYDHEQAKTISELFSQQSHCTVTKTFSDLGLEFPAKPVGRTRKELSAVEAKERDDQRRAKKTESQRKWRAKMAAGR